MKRVAATVAAGFSLIEVIITVGVISFALVGLLGIFPIALEQTRGSIDETRSVQLARMVFATLTAEPFDAVKCFGEEQSETLDLGLQFKNSAPVVLFASYDPTLAATKEAALLRTNTAPANAEYRLELSFDPEAGDPPRGTVAKLKILAYPARKVVIFESSQFISRFPHAVFAK